MHSLTGRIVRTMIDGRAVSFFVNNDVDHIQSHHGRGEFYEPEGLAIIARHFDGGCFVDIGSNVGNHAIYVAKFLAPKRVICIEPNPEAIQILTANLQLNGLGDVDTSYLGIGLSDAEGMAALEQVQMNNIGAMQLRPDAAGDIRLATGDALLSGEHPSFLKIDVEGMEIDVLNGLGGVIERCSPRIFVEIDEHNRAAFEAWCDGHGYVVAERFQRYVANENFLVVREDVRVNSW